TGSRAVDNLKPGPNRVAFIDHQFARELVRSRIDQSHAGHLRRIAGIELASASLHDLISEPAAALSCERQHQRASVGPVEHHLTYSRRRRACVYQDQPGGISTA